MVLESLILSQDRELVSVLRPTLEALSIDVEICQEVRTGNAALSSDKFDAVIVDCDDLEGGLTVLQQLRTTPSNKNSVAFAVLNGKKTTTREAFGLGANFVLQKPITELNASRCFHAALNFMLKERRRYFRQPVKMPVQVVVEGQTLLATSTNISEGGMALMLPGSLPKGATPILKFSLPHTQLSIEVEAQVAWADGKGLAGLRFQHVSNDVQNLLISWLDARIEEDFPGVSERIAAAGDAPASHTKGFVPPPDRGD